jgi:hypothetical protein
MGAEPVQYPEAVIAKDPNSGVNFWRAGAALAGEPVVTVADLLAHPETYAGKAVRLEGNVTAMCTHERAWFAVQDNDRSGHFVRVSTTPAFLVPQDAIGKRARTEGVVEVVDANASQSEHLAKEHQLAAGQDSSASGKSVTVRARGAEFL